MGHWLLKLLTFIEIMIFLSKARNDETTKDDIHKRQPTDRVHPEDQSPGSSDLGDPLTKEN
jgi:hypothetical protein